MGTHSNKDADVRVTGVHKYVPSLAHHPYTVESVPVDRNLVPALRRDVTERMAASIGRGTEGISSGRQLYAEPSSSTDCMMLRKGFHANAA